MTNKLFCYWLQGYFEISQETTLTRKKIHLIQQQLNKIDEPLGDYTQWLIDLLAYLEPQHQNQALLNYFLTDISDQLNLIFHHVVDDSYDTDASHLTLKKIHDGLMHDK